MIETLFIWAFDHYVLLGALIAIVCAALVIKIGRPRRIRGLLGYALIVLAVIATGGWIYMVATLTHAIEHRTSVMTFASLGSTQSQRVADLHGKVVVLNYWATWCPPCHHEMGDLNRLAENYRGRDVVVLTVSDEDEAQLRKYMTKYPLQTTVARFSSDLPHGALETMAYGGRPTTVILDRDGNIRQMFIGGRKFDDFDSAVRKAM